MFDYIGIKLQNRREAMRELSGEALRRASTTNVMSPKLLQFRKLAGVGHGPLIAEVSEGEFLGSKLYGVTTFHILPGSPERDWDASKACHTLGEVEAHLRYLNGEEPA